MAKLKERSIVPVPMKKINLVENSRVDNSPGDMGALMNSMRQRGLLQPVGVRSDGSGGYNLVFGHRRFEAALKLGWKTIDAIIVTDFGGTNQDLIDNAIENTLRVDVSLPEQGRIYWNLVEGKGDVEVKMTPQEIAARVGIPFSKVRSALNAFKKVPVKYREQISSSRRGFPKVPGKISPSNALLVVGLQKKFGLSPAQIESLYEFSKTDTATGDHLRCVAMLMNNDVPFKKALKQASKMRRISLSVMLPERVIEDLEDEQEKDIIDILYERLLQNEDLELIANDERSIYRIQQQGVRKPKSPNKPITADSDKDAEDE